MKLMFYRIFFVKKYVILIQIAPKISSFGLKYDNSFSTVGVFQL